MGTVTASGEQVVDAPVEKVRAALADYATVRPTILPAQYTDYEVRSGGTGAGTVAAWKFHASAKRVRDCLIDVTSPEPGTLIETDRNSTLVTTITAAPAGSGRTTVRITTTWQGASGIGGFFERTFAPPALRRVYGETLTKLADRLRA
jgi:hypothetical protein